MVTGDCARPTQAMTHCYDMEELRPELLPPPDSVTDPPAANGRSRSPGITTTNHHQKASDVTTPSSNGNAWPTTANGKQRTDSYSDQRHLTAAAPSGLKIYHDAAPTPAANAGDRHHGNTGGYTVSVDANYRNSNNQFANSNLTPVSNASHAPGHSNVGNTSSSNPFSSSGGGNTAPAVIRGFTFDGSLMGGPASQPPPTTGRSSGTILGTPPAYTGGGLSNTVDHLL